MCLEGEAGELDPKGGRLGVHAVRAPDAQGRAVLARPRGERGDERMSTRHDDLPGALELQRQRCVEHVARRQPVVDPTPGRTGRTGQHIDERGHVVVGRPLALVDRLDGERGGADRVEVRSRRPLHRLARRDLDVAPRLHARLIAPEGGQLGSGVAGDHRDSYAARMRAASAAAFFGLSTPTQATGTPGGICATDSSASSPPATVMPLVSGTPITGRSVCAATTPGSAADRPAPAMMTFSPRERALFAYAATLSGSRCADMTLISFAMPRSVSSFA